MSMSEFVLSAISAFKANLLFGFQDEFIQDQLALWARDYNHKYVAMLEELLNDGFTHHQLNDEKSYGRRSYEAHSMRKVFVPPHLYGQLAVSKEGMEILIKEGPLQEMFRLLRESKNAKSVPDNVALKAAIWAVCNIASTPDGASLVEREKSIPAIVSVLENNETFSICGTAYYALSLVATTRTGVRLLSSAGWCALRYARDEKWPVLEEWFLNQLAQLHLLDTNLRLEAEEEERQLLLQDDEDTADRSEDISGIAVAQDQDGLGAPLALSTPKTTAEEGSETSSSSRGTLSRKRLSKMFRSFSLGHSNSSNPKSGSSPQPRSGQAASGSSAPSDAETNRKRFSAKLKRKLFSKSSQSEDPNAGDDNSGNVNSGSHVLEDTAVKKNEEETGAIPKRRVEAPIAIAEDDFSTSSGTKDTVDSSERRKAQVDTASNGKETMAVVPRSAVCKLSPIASNNSISVHNDSSEHHSRGAEEATKEEEDETEQEVETAAERKEKEDGEKKTPPPRTRSHTRSGQRALSESEAQNIVLGGKFCSGIPPLTAGADPAGGSLAPGGCGSGMTTPVAGGATGGRSVTSISSAGSWGTDNPNYFTLRSIHQRRRPNLVQEGPNGGSSSKNNGAGDSLDGQEGLILNPSESRSSPAGGSSLPRRSDTWSRHTRSLDYKVIRMRPRFSTLQSGEVKRPLARMLPLAEESSAEGGPEPRYWGIALPVDIGCLFQKRPEEEEGDDEGNDDKVAKAKNSSPGGEDDDDDDGRGDSNNNNFPGRVNDWLARHHILPGSGVAGKEGEEEEVRLASFHGLEFHTTTNCLACAKFVVDPEDGDGRRPRASSLSIPEEAQQQQQDRTLAHRHQRGSLSNQGSPQVRAKQHMHGKRPDEELLEPAAYGSGESLSSFRDGNNAAQQEDSGRLAAESSSLVMGKVMLRKEALKIISSMCASVGAKTAEQGLLK